MSDEKRPTKDDLLRQASQIMQSLLGALDSCEAVDSMDSVLNWNRAWAMLEEVEDHE